ncbi:type II toxin-antitoxin system CcdA family antitoxin [Inquilinus limosus]|uniref:type II toxin-antitoxin system CcdA family antitoxin n=1 Tax=Inquilinus limosus TaxID=171674 RepID=UPI003F18CC11
MPDRNKTKDRDPKDKADEARRREEAAAWKERNAEAIRSHNERVEREGLILEKYWRLRCDRHGGTSLAESDGLAMRTVSAHTVAMISTDEKRTPRRATNLSLSAEATRRAREYGLNISRIAEDAIVEAVRRYEGELWKQQNAEAIRSYNEWVAEEGLPFAKFRQF